jgi:hypothetical protein
MLDEDQTGLIGEVGQHGTRWGFAGSPNPRPRQNKKALVRREILRPSGPYLSACPLAGRRDGPFYSTSLASGTFSAVARRRSTLTDGLVFWPASS